jgi:hypothetical protein
VKEDEQERLREENKSEEEEEEENHSLITISVKTLSGNSLAFNVKKSLPFKNCLMLVRDREGIEVDRYRPPIFAGKQISRQSIATAHSHGIRDGSVIHLISNLRGC